MERIVISGYGKMGRIIEQVLLERGLECVGVSEDIRSFDRKLASGSVCIDFTSPEAFRNNYRFLAENFKAVVVGTTGWQDILPQVKSCFEENHTPMIYASNFSIGVNICFKMTELLSRLVNECGGYRATLKEIHHVHKLDSPSGTAVSMASVVERWTGNAPEIESVREGEVPGTHILSFTGNSDRITLTHEAFSRRGFAEGAVQAALWTASIKGVCEFRELMDSKMHEGLHEL